MWQVHYQILPIIFLKEFIELDVNTDMMIKNVRLSELNTLCEKCPNTKLFLVRIFLYSDWNLRIKSEFRKIRTRKNSVFGHFSPSVSIATVLFQYINFKDDLIEYKRLCSNKNYQHKFDEKLREQFYNT